MAVTMNIGAGPELVAILGFAEFREPVAVTGRKLGAAVDNAVHKSLLGDESERLRWSYF
jgi:hypothetical protein